MYKRQVLACRKLLFAAQKGGKPSPELLQRISNTTGGSSYIATDGKELVQSMHAVLDQLEKTRFEAARSSYTELFHLLLVPGVMLVGLEVFLRAFLLRRFP